MAEKNKSYWVNRQEQWLTTQDKDDERISNRLEKDYQRTAKELEKDISTYFNRYGQDNVIEFRTMLQDLAEDDRNLLFQDMDRFAEKYPQYADLMPVRQSVYQLNRLEGLHYSTQMKLLELGAIEQTELEKHLEKTYGKHYKNMMKELGIGNQFLAIDDMTMRNTLFTGWVNGENFSDRIWTNKEKMLDHMQTVYRDGLARGDNYAKLTKAIRERFGVGASDAKRLVWTESSFVLNQAHAQAYQNAGTEEYGISAIRDNKTSLICREMDGKVFRFDEMEVGLNFPPFHPYCRTTFIGILEPSEQDTQEMVESAYGEIISENVISRVQAEEAIESEIKELRDVLKEAERSAEQERRQAIAELRYQLEDGLITSIEYNERSRKILEEFSGGKTGELRKQVRNLSVELTQLREQHTYDNARDVKAALGKYREMGIGDIDMTGHLTRPRAKATKAIMQAYDHYPTEWVKKSVEHGTITTKTTNRGYYSPGRAEMAISGGRGKHTDFRTALHELGHRMEHVDPKILAAEKLFYDRRTEGESLKRLRDVTGNGGYKAHEVTKVDDFIEPYMGRDYEGRAYEVLTMGVETLYTEPVKLSHDPDMFNWVVEMLLTK